MPEHTTLVEHFRRFLLWDVIVCAVSAVVLLVIYLFYGSPFLLVIFSEIILYLGLLAWAYRRARQSDLNGAALAIAVGILVIALSLGLMATAGASVAVLLAVLSVMLGLPYMSGPTLRRLIIGVVLVSAAVGSIELTGDGLMPPPPMPTWALATVLGVAVPATGGLVFLLVLQYSSRLTDTIRQIRAANVELQSSRRRVVNAQEQLRGEVAQQLHGPVQNRLLVVLQWLRMDQADHGADNPDFAIVAEGHDGASAMRLVRDYAPDVLLLDVELPDMHSTQVAEEVHAEHPDVKVVLMSAYYDKAFSEQSGVEYIPKVEFSVSRLREVSGSLLDAGPKGR